jgi:Neuraminidase (sialidase)
MFSYNPRKYTTDKHSDPVRIGHRVEHAGRVGIVEAIYSVSTNGTTWHEVDVTLTDGSERMTIWDASQITLSKV